MNFDYEKNIWGKGTATLRWTDPANVRLRRIMRSFFVLPDGARILDVGCGVGIFTRAVKEKKPLWQCFGADISEQAIIAARSLTQNVSFDICEENRLPYSDNFFDGVFFADVLEHVVNPAIFLSEIYRVLKPGGILYAFIPCEGDPTSFWKWLDALNLKNDLTRKFAGHINFFSRSQVRNIFKQSGFEILSSNYSEHFLGQLLGIAVFYSLNRASKNSGEILNNTAYVDEFSAKKGGGFKMLKSFVNWLVTLESELFSRLPSPNMHITAVKK